MEHIVRSSSCALFDFHETPGGHFRCAASFFLFHFPLHFVSFVLLFLLLLRLLLLLFMHLFIYLSGCSFYYSFLSFFYVWIWKELVDKIPLIIDWNTTADLLLVSAVKEGRTPTWRYDHKRLFDDDNFPSVAVDIFFHTSFLFLFLPFSFALSRADQRFSGASVPSAHWNNCNVSYRRFMMPLESFDSNRICRTWTMSSKTHRSPFDGLIYSAVTFDHKYLLNLN